MATRFMYKTLSIATLGIALTLSIAATTTTSSASSNMAGAVELLAPEPPSHLSTSSWYDRRKRETWLTVTWRDNSTDEDGFILEVWRRNESGGGWVLGWSIAKPANSTGDGFIFSGRQSPYKFRVKAFNASGESAWSNWTR